MVTHCTQKFACVLHFMRPVIVQSLSTRHWTQRSVIVSHTLPSGLFAQSVDIKHCTQYIAVVLHLGVGLMHIASVVQLATHR